MASTYSIFSTYNHQTILQAFAQFMSARKGVGEVTTANHVATIAGDEHAAFETTMIYIHSIPARMQMEYKMFGPSYL